MGDFIPNARTQPLPKNDLSNSENDLQQNKDLMLQQSVQLSENKEVSDTELSNKGKTEIQPNQFKHHNPNLWEIVYHNIQHNNTVDVNPWRSLKKIVSLTISL